MKTLLAASILLMAGLSHAQEVWQPAQGHRQIALWPGAVPDARTMSGPEKVTRTGSEHYVAGKSWLSIERVAQPTMTLYPAQGKNTGAAVIVLPGGGYEILAIDLEGSEVCDWLVTRGVTCVLLKYRVPAPRSAPYWGAYPQSPMALEDAQRTISLVRSRAAEWHINPHKIGVLGFSAGGHLVVA
jgi:acetyl esterase/lipase